jgi:hypothetical protein
LTSHVRDDEIDVSIFEAVINEDDSISSAGHMIECIVEVADFRRSAKSEGGIRRKKISRIRSVDRDNSLEHVLAYVFVVFLFKSWRRSGSWDFNLLTGEGQAQPERRMLVLGSKSRIASQLRSSSCNRVSIFDARIMALL